MIQVLIPQPCAARMAGTQRDSVPMGKVSGGGEGEGEEGFNLQKKLEDLELVGDEEEGLDFSEEIEELIKETRWLAIFKVHTTKPFSHAALMNAMRFAWSAAKEITFKVLGPNLFLAQFHCLGDWNRAMDGGPWLFRGAAVSMEEYDGFSDVKKYKLDHIPVWVRIQGIPDGVMKRKDMAEKVASKVGDPPITVMVNEGKINPTTYLRARVFHSMEKPLVRVVQITFKERNNYLVQYEKLPLFCFHCGHLDHELTECGDGVHEKASCGWGEWLVVNQGGSSGGRETGRQGMRDGRGRGGARGRGRGVPGGVMEEDEEMEYAEDYENTRAIIPVKGKGGAFDSVVSPIKEQDKKRSRQAVEGDAKKQLDISASSNVEDDRKQ